MEPMGPHILRMALKCLSDRGPRNKVGEVPSVPSSFLLHSVDTAEAE